MEAIIKH